MRKEVWDFVQYTDVVEEVLSRVLDGKGTEEDKEYLLRFIDEYKRLRVLCIGDKVSQQKGMENRKRIGGMGRPKVKVPKNFLELEWRVKQGYLTVDEACKKMNMKRSTFYKRRRDLEKEIIEFRKSKE